VLRSCSTGAVSLLPCTLRAGSAVPYVCTRGGGTARRRREEKPRGPLPAQWALRLRACARALRSLSLTPPPSRLCGFRPRLLQLSNDMTPKEIVNYLNNHIVGQADAKRAIAIAMRNRWRRMQLESPLKEEVVPKNILMIGPTGVGKTEVARRLAKLAGAPFVKVEATKYTEVGFHGKDVDTMIKDLVDVAINLQRNKMKEAVKAEVSAAVENRILDILAGDAAQTSTRESFRTLLREGALDERTIEVELPVNNGNKVPSQVDACLVACRMCSLCM